ncbi:DNA-directed RNA polymerase subunit omega [Fodinisporobacter ferrooxydans]|uniref:DNA-directed RNA polymerase subunit omega n=1 Tax=Fodinisporobacter ferrooxydans TaxID=2901836 RepID=A0ABY4CIX5_9BACL|nr:DNA-directed RNA polymerase subunit omega [Alicyclobacillaceae bacterium MYW30-H2]
MLYPSIDRLVELSDSKYSLVVAAAKRARMLQEGAQKKIDSTKSKNVSVALQEIATQKIRFVRTKEGIK